jgi:hypothetical protein
MQLTSKTVLPGISFGVLVILLALCNSWVGLYPFGPAVWLRPLLGLIGIAGAICLFLGNGWWRILLPVWCLAQTWVIATDRSGEWFYQGLKAGWSSSSTSRMNEIVMSYQAHGINFAGIILLGALVIIGVFHLHPPVRVKPSAKHLKLLAAFIVALACGFGFNYWRDRAAVLVLTLDLPRVPIYYKGQMLGRTPLRITPERIREWKLPLDTSRPLELNGGWADRVDLSDGKTILPLYFGVPWPFSQYLDTFEVPWGTRCRVHVGWHDGNRREGFAFPKPALRNEPILTIQKLDAEPIAAGSSLRLRCVLNNPTRKSYKGRQAVIGRVCCSYERVDSVASLPARREVTMPASWNTLPAGATMNGDIELDAPLAPGDYELFCTWFLYPPESSSSGGAGSIYSNVLELHVK